MTVPDVVEQVVPGDDPRRDGVRRLQVRIEAVLRIAAPVVVERDELTAGVFADGG